jgi:hypothetical protein
MREYQVRICEGLGVKFPGPTRRLLPIAAAAEPATQERCDYDEYPCSRGYAVMAHSGSVGLGDLSASDSWILREDCIRRPCRCPGMGIIRVPTNGGRVVNWRLVYDAPHNLIWSDGQNHLHCKGACPACNDPKDAAFPDGHPVIVPGSMGDASYVLKGQGSTASLCSARAPKASALKRIVRPRWGEVRPRRSNG